MLGGAAPCSLIEQYSNMYFYMFIWVYMTISPSTKKLIWIVCLCGLPVVNQKINEYSGFGGHIHNHTPTPLFLVWINHAPPRIKNFTPWWRKKGRNPWIFVSTVYGTAIVISSGVHSVRHGSTTKTNYSTRYTVHCTVVRSEDIYWKKHYIGANGPMDLFE